MTKIFLIDIDCMKKRLTLIFALFVFKKATIKYTRRPGKEWENFMHDRIYILSNMPSTNTHKNKTDRFPIFKEENVRLTVKKKTILKTIILI